MAKPGISAEVERHFEDYPDERAPISRFVDLFEVKWAHRARNGTPGRSGYSEFSCYLLKPKTIAEDTFGFDRELLLVYSPHSGLEPRTLKHTEELTKSARLKGRPDPLYLVLVGPFADVDAELMPFKQDASVGRILIGFTSSELESDQDPWLLRARFSRALFTRDLFDMRKAIVDDRYFFGRQAFVLELIDRFKRGDNSGVFGLRKTGKTSTLLRVKRLLEAQGSSSVVLLEAEGSGVYDSRWWEILSRIKDEAAATVRKTLPHPLDKPFTAQTAAKRFRSALEFLLGPGSTPSRRLLVIIDEVEFITPGLSPARHWAEDFLPLWRELRATQVHHQGLGLLVAGVNGQLLESPNLLDQDNPVYSLFGLRYLPSFSVQEIADMIRPLGKRMGMVFAKGSEDYLHSRYGGHPLLIRLACSWEHKARLDTRTTAATGPVTITVKELEETEDVRDNSLVDYGEHVLGVLKRWYPEEYDLLALLASGDIDEFARYSKELPESIKHLRAYGLVALEPTPRITIALVAKYLSRASRPAPASIRPSSINGAPGFPRTRSLPDMIAEGEGPRTEFKSTLRMDLRTKKPSPEVEHAALKTIAGFLNTDGGVLFIGIDDTGRPLGLAEDNFQNEDKFLLHLGHLIRDRLGAEFANALSTTFFDLANHRVLAVDVRPSPSPAYVRSKGAKDQFFVRLLGSTQELNMKQVVEYTATRFRKNL